MGSSSLCSSTSQGITIPIGAKFPIAKLIVHLAMVAISASICHARIITPDPHGQREAALRGIEKKDIRLVILYDPAETVDAQAEELARTVTVDAIASGAKLTKADAARDASSRPSPRSSAQLQALFPANSPAVFFGATAKQNAGDCVPPPDCGCDKGSWSDCVCIVWRKKSGDLGCLCRLCFLSPTGGFFRSAGFTGNRTIFIVLGEKLQKSLTEAEWWERNRSWFEKEVWAQVQAAPATTNLVIKTKSTLE